MIPSDVKVFINNDKLVITSKINAKTQEKREINLKGGLFNFGGFKITIGNKDYYVDKTALNKVFSDLIPANFVADIIAKYNQHPKADDVALIRVISSTKSFKKIEIQLDELAKRDGADESSIKVLLKIYKTLSLIKSETFPEAFTHDLKRVVSQAEKLLSALFTNFEESIIKGNLDHKNAKVLTQFFKHVSGIAQNEDVNFTDLNQFFTDAQQAAEIVLNSYFKIVLQNLEKKPEDRTREDTFQLVGDLECLKEIPNFLKEGQLNKLNEVKDALYLTLVNELEHHEKLIEKFIEKPVEESAHDFDTFFSSIHSLTTLKNSLFKTYPLHGFEDLQKQVASLLTYADRQLKAQPQYTAAINAAKAGLARSKGNDAVTILTETGQPLKAAGSVNPVYLFNQKGPEGERRSAVLKDVKGLKRAQEDEALMQELFTLQGSQGFVPSSVVSSAAPVKLGIQNEHEKQASQRNFRGYVLSEFDRSLVDEKAFEYLVVDESTDKMEKRLGSETLTEDQLKIRTTQVKDKVNPNYLKKEDFTLPFIARLFEKVRASDKAIWTSLDENKSSYDMMKDKPYTLITANNEKVNVTFAQLHQLLNKGDISTHFFIQDGTHFDGTIAHQSQVNASFARALAHHLDYDYSKVILTPSFNSEAEKKQYEDFETKEWTCSTIDRNVLHNLSFKKLQQLFLLKKIDPSTIQIDGKFSAKYQDDPKAQPLKTKDLIIKSLDTEWRAIFPVPVRENINRSSRTPPDVPYQAIGGVAFKELIPHMILSSHAQDNGFINTLYDRLTEDSSFDAVLTGEFQYHDLHGANLGFRPIPNDEFKAYQDSLFSYQLLNGTTRKNVSFDILVEDSLTAQIGDRTTIREGEEPVDWVLVGSELKDMPNLKKALEVKWEVVLFDNDLVMTESNKILKYQGHHLPPVRSAFLETQWKDKPLSEATIEKLMQPGRLTKSLNYMKNSDAPIRKRISKDKLPELDQKLRTFLSRPIYEVSGYRADNNRLGVSTVRHAFAKNVSNISITENQDFWNFVEKEMNAFEAQHLKKTFIREFKQANHGATPDDKAIEDYVSTHLKEVNLHTPEAKGKRLKIANQLFPRCTHKQQQVYSERMRNQQKYLKDYKELKNFTGSPDEKYAKAVDFVNHHKRLFNQADSKLLERKIEEMTRNRKPEFINLILKNAKPSYFNVMKSMYPHLAKIYELSYLLADENPKYQHRIIKNGVTVTLPVECAAGANLGIGIFNEDLEMVYSLEEMIKAGLSSSNAQSVARALTTELNLTHTRDFSY